MVSVCSSFRVHSNLIELNLVLLYKLKVLQYKFTPLEQGQLIRGTRLSLKDKMLKSWEHSLGTLGSPSTAQKPLANVSPSEQGQRLSPFHSMADSLLWASSRSLLILLKVNSPAAGGSTKAPLCCQRPHPTPLL